MKFSFDGGSLQEIFPSDFAIPGYLDLTHRSSEVAFLNLPVPTEMAGHVSGISAMPLIVEILFIAIAIFGIYKAIVWFVRTYQQKSSHKM